MPYNETIEQAWQYYNIGKDNISRGQIGTARSHLTLACTMAVKNNCHDLVKLIDDLLDDIS